MILLDISMPVMTGIEMFEKLRGEKELKDIPVIMLTSESGKEAVTKAVRMGVHDYIVKPFEKDHLVERIGPPVSTEHFLALRPTAKNGGVRQKAFPQLKHLVWNQLAPTEK